MTTRALQWTPPSGDDVKVLPTGRRSVPPAAWTNGPRTHWRISADAGGCLTDAQLLHQALSQAAQPAKAVRRDHP
ncbi:hypothetical protein AB0H07_40420 [Streptomyces sp. NPDC021354]|uniref:hypothetical protein n=1 Tax=Streptomyces sp. NPDC021354 TaxID=3154793 RepID=UPI0033FF727B